MRLDGDAFHRNTSKPAAGAWSPPSNSVCFAVSVIAVAVFIVIAVAVVSIFAIVVFAVVTAIADVRSRWGFERSSGTLVDLLLGRGAHPATAKHCPLPSICCYQQVGGAARATTQPHPTC